MTQLSVARLRFVLRTDLHETGANEIFEHTLERPGPVDVAGTFEFFTDGDE